MHVLLKWTFWAAGIYMCYGLLMFLFQRHVIYPRYMIGSAPPATAATPGIEKTWIDTRFGAVEAWYLKPTPKAAGRPHPVVIFGHGNAELIDFWPEELRAFTHLGVGVLLVEFPGYGRSAGTPSQQRITETFVNAYDTIAARPEVDEKKVVLFGRSLGGGAVCALADERPAAALILMSAFTSIRSFAPGHLLPGFLVRDPFDNLSAVSRFPGPVWVIHGRFDEVIAYRHGVALARAAKQSTLLTLDCGHNDLPPGWFGFASGLAEFLTDAGIVTPDAGKRTDLSGMDAAD